jgi:transcriptional regulator with GAF, ATPase, and Fis domain
MEDKTVSKVKTLNIDNVLLVLKEVKGSQKKAAEKLNSSPATVSRLLKEHGYTIGEVVWVQQGRAS